MLMRFTLNTLHAALRPLMPLQFHVEQMKKSLPLGKSRALICHMARSINPDELLTVSQAAAERGTTRQAINYLIKQGKLEAVEIAGKRFISRRILAGFIPDPGGRPAKARKKKSG